MIRIVAGLGLLLAFTGCAGVIRDRIYHPTSLADTPVEFVGQAPQSVTARTADGLELQAYYWPPARPDGDVAVYFHGNGYNHLVGAARAEPLRIGGRGVLVASYRGYGGNPGRPSEAGLFADGDAWMKRIAELAPASRRFLFGHSLGGAVALEMAARHPVEGVATLGTFTRMSDMAPAVARGLITDRFDNLAAIRRVRTPVFLLHGDADELVPFSSAAALKEVGGERVTVVRLRGAGHNLSLETIADRVWLLLNGR